MTHWASQMLIWQYFSTFPKVLTAKRSSFDVCRCFHSLFSTPAKIVLPQSSKLNTSSAQQPLRIRGHLFRSTPPFHFAFKSTHYWARLPFSRTSRQRLTILQENKQPTSPGDRSFFLLLQPFLIPPSHNSFPHTRHRKKKINTIDQRGKWEENPAWKTC